MMGERHALRDETSPQILADLLCSNLQLLGAVIKIVFSSPSLLQHLGTLLLFHLLLVLQSGYLLTLVFHLPIGKREKNQAFHIYT